MSVVTRKVKIIPIGTKEEINAAYDYIRKGQECFARMLNQYMSAVYTAKINDASLDELKEINALYQRTPDSPKGSAYDAELGDIYPVGLPVAGNVPHIGKQKLDKAFKDRLKYGRVSLPTYKSTYPIPIPKYYTNPRNTIPVPGTDRFKDTGLFHGYNSPADFFRRS